MEAEPPEGPMQRDASKDERWSNERRGPHCELPRKTLSCIAAQISTGDCTARMLLLIKYQDVRTNWLGVSSVEFCH